MLKDEVFRRVGSYRWSERIEAFRRVGAPPVVVVIGSPTGWQRVIPGQVNLPFRISRSRNPDHFTSVALSIVLLVLLHPPSFLFYLGPTIERV